MTSKSKCSPKNYSEEEDCSLDDAAQVIRVFGDHLTEKKEKKSLSVFRFLTSIYMKGLQNYHI